jgi:hypothetical protein
VGIADCRSGGQDRTGRIEVNQRVYRLGAVHIRQSARIAGVVMDQRDLSGRNLELSSRLGAFVCQLLPAAGQRVSSVMRLVTVTRAFR